MAYVKAYASKSGKSTRLVILQYDSVLAVITRRFAVNSEHGIFHGIDTYAGKNSIENKRLFSLIYNRVGVTVNYNALINNNKNNPIDNIIYIINGIFHGISRGL